MRWGREEGQGTRMRRFMGKWNDEDGREEEVPAAECPVSKQVSYQRATNRSLTCRYNLSVLADLLV